MNVNVDLTADDFRALVASVRAGRKLHFRVPRLDLVLVWLALVAFFVVAYSGKWIHVPSLFVGIGMVGVLSLWFQKRCMAKLAPSPDSPFFLSTAFAFSETGFTVSTAKHDARISWSFITEVRETPEHFFLMVGNLDGVIIPKRCLGSEQATDQFRRLVAASKKLPS